MSFTISLRMLAYLTTRNPLIGQVEIVSGYLNCLLEFGVPLVLTRTYLGLSHLRNEIAPASQNYC